MPPRTSVPFPVPSAPTLRFLRQAVLLGSFGTFAGAAVLLAEERRRRIRVAKKIIDNGRRLRESRGRVRRTPSSAAGITTMSDGEEADLNLLLQGRTERSAYAAGEVERVYKSLNEGLSKRRRKRLKFGHEELLQEKPVHEAANDLVELVSKPSRIGQDSVNSIRPRRNGSFCSWSPHMDKNHLRGVTWRSRLTRRHFSTTGPNTNTSYAAQQILNGDYAILETLQVNRDSSGFTEVSPEVFSRPPHDSEDLHSGAKKSSLKSQTSIVAYLTNSEGPSKPAHVFDSQPSTDVGGTRPVRSKRSRGQSYKRFYEYYVRTYEAQPPRTRQGSESVSSILSTEPPVETQLENKVFMARESDEDACKKVCELLQASDSMLVAKCYHDLASKWRKRQRYLPTEHFLQLGEDLLRLVANNDAALVQNVGLIWSSLDAFRGRGLQSSSEIILIASKRLLAEDRGQTAAELLFSTILKGEAHDSPAGTNGWMEWQTRSRTMSDVIDLVISNRDSSMSCGQLLSIVQSNPRYYSEYLSNAISKCKIALESLDDAVALFRRAFTPSIVQHDRGIQELVCTLCRAISNKGSLDCLRALIEWSASQGGVNQTFLETLLTANHRQNRHHENAQLYLSYWRSVKFSENLHNILLDAISRSLPIDVAIPHVQSVTASLPQESRQNIYSIYFPNLLTRCYNETRNMKMVEKAFRQIESNLGNDCVPEIVQRVVQLQLTSLGPGDGQLPPKLKRRLSDSSSQTSLGHLSNYMLLFAKRGRWDVVELILNDAHRRGIIQAAKPSMRAKFINTALKQLVLQEDSKEVIRFVLRSINAHSIIPDDATLRLVLKSLIKDGRTGAVILWIRYFRKRGFNLRIDARTCVAMLGAYYAARHPSEAMLLKIRTVLCDFDDSLVSKEFYSLLRLAFARLRSVIHPSPRTRASWELWFTSWMQQLRRWENNSRETYQMRNVIGDLAFSMSDKDSKAVVEKYKELIDLRAPQAGNVLQTSVEASLREDVDSPKQAIALIQTVQEMGVDVSAAASPLMHQTILGKKRSPDEIYRAVMASYEKFADRNGEIKHDLAVSAARELIDRYMENGAVRLLSAVYMSPQFRQNPAGIEFMTCFLQAYIRQRNLDGMGWVVDQVLQQDMLIDLVFLRQFRSAKREFRHANARSKGSGNAATLPDEELTSRLEDFQCRCYNRYKAQRAKTARMGWELTYAIIKAKSGRGTAIPVKGPSERFDVQAGVSMDSYKSLRSR